MTLRKLGIVSVLGRSMEPTLHEGDRLLVLYGARPRPGRLVAARLVWARLASARWRCDRGLTRAAAAVDRRTARGPTHPAGRLPWPGVQEDPTTGVRDVDNVDSVDRR